jgi:hypothetical protein
MLCILSLHCEVDHYSMPKLSKTDVYHTYEQLMHVDPVSG